MSSARWQPRAPSRPAGRRRGSRWRDPYAVRALVLVALVATFSPPAASDGKRIAAAFDWQGVVLPANFRVDAWVIPPTLYRQAAGHAAGHPSGRNRGAAAVDRPVAVPVNSTLVVRSTGKVDLDVSGTGGVTAVEGRR